MLLTYKASQVGHVGWALIMECKEGRIESDLKFLNLNSLDKGGITKSDSGVSRQREGFHKVRQHVTCAKGP